MGIYAGDNYIVHAWSSKIVKTTIEYVVKCGYPYRGWGWQAGLCLDSGSDSPCSCSENFAGEYVCTTSGSNLTIRSGHGSSYGSLGKIPNGATVYVSKANGEWAHVEYDGISGYASMEYLTPTRHLVDLGTDFTAPILNKAAWKPIENSRMGGDNRLVRMQQENGKSNQLWYFSRQADGSYMISSCYDGEYLDVRDASMEQGAAIQVVGNSGSDAQKWYIYENNGGYILESKLSGMVLDMPNNDATSGNALIVWGKHGGDSQTWAIYRGDECRLKGQTLSVFPGDSQTPTRFTWTEAYGETNYSVRIWKGTYWVGNPYHDEWGATSGCSILLPEGTYQAYVDAANHYNCEMSNVVEFTVQSHAHSWGSWTKVDGTNHNRTCSECYATEAVAHTWDSGKITLHATCAAVGEKTYACTVCKTTKTEILDRLTEHSYTYSRTTAPTTTTEGKITGTCSKCNGTTTVTLPKLNRTDYNYSELKAATCTTTGTGRYTWKTTTYGTFSFDVTILAAGHNYSYEVSFAPTATSSGVLTGICSKCSSTTSYDIPAINTENYKYSETEGKGFMEWTNQSFGAIRFEIPAIGIVQQPHTLTVRAGENAEFSVVAKGENLSYQWQWRTNTAEWENCTDVTEGFQSSTMQPSYVSFDNQNEYRCIITDIYGNSMISDTVTLILESIGGSCGENLIWTLRSDGTLIISGTGAMSDYNPKTKAPWSAVVSDIKRVIVSKGITSIGNYAFYFCKNLTEVTIADSVTSVGNQAFLRCESLDNVLIPNTVTQIGVQSFRDCTSLSKIVIPNSVREIGEQCFHNCKNLNTIILPDGLEVVAKDCFSYCESLERVVLPDTTVVLDGACFALCSNLKEIILSPNTTTLKSACFMGCSALSEIVLPESVTAIGAYSFEECTGIEKIVFEGDAPSIDSHAFDGITVVCMYNPQKSGWNVATQSEYGGNITWQPIDIPVSIAVKQLPDKLTYLPSEELDTTGMQLKLIYEDNSSEVISEGFTVEGFVPGGDAVQTVTVKYEDFTAEFEVYVGEAKFKSAALVLSGQIGVNFYMTLDGIAKAEDSYIEFSVAGKNGETTTIPFSSGELDANGRYVFTCYVSSIQMADEITAVYHFGDREVEQKYSIQRYVEKTLASGTVKPESKVLAQAIANYGHYAQVYLSDYRGWTMGVDHAEMPAYGQPNTGVDLSSFTTTVTNRHSYITKLSRQLGLDADTTLYILLDVDGAAHPEDIRITVRDEYGNPAEANVTRLADGHYQAAIPNISAHKLGMKYSIVVDDTMVIETSVLAYAAATLSSASSSASAKQAMAALYEYYAATMAFRG